VDVVLSPAERARPVPCRERGRLVEEEELGEEPGMEELPSLPAFELEPARDPALRGVTAPDPPGRVVEAAAVPVDEPAARARDQVAERRDAILERHRPQRREGAAGR